MSLLESDPSPCHGAKAFIIEIHNNLNTGKILNLICDALSYYQKISIKRDSCEKCSFQILKICLYISFF